MFMQRPAVCLPGLMSGNAQGSCFLFIHCRNCGLDDADCKIAYYVVIERLKGKELYDAIGYSEAQSKRKRTKILKLINN